MGFQLVIAEGKEAGREFDFDQDAIVIGRTADCDVILYEAGVSRRHARIERGSTGYWIEDLGSSNGTRVNLVVISERQALEKGDAIGIGPIVFRFSPVDLEPEAPTELTELEGAHTRILTVAELKKSRNKAVALLPRDATRDQVSELGGRSTQMMPALRPRPSLSKRAPSQAPAPQPHDTVPTAVPESITRPTRNQTAEHPVSAAELARLRRGDQRSRLKAWWIESPPAQKKIVLFGSVTLALLTLGSSLFAAWPDPPRPPVREPDTLSGEPIEASFGLGKGVTFERIDSKSFEFEVNAPVQAVAVLRYQAKDINRIDEVAIALNGHALGEVPADTIDVADRTLEQVLPAHFIRRGEPNTVVFDSLLNPPGHDPWRVWNVWLEVAYLPDKDPAGMLVDAEASYRRGLEKWERRDIGAGNRWAAYHAFRESWLILEAIPGEKPLTSKLAREHMNEAKRELDERCRELLLKARSAYEMGKPDKARMELEHVSDFFPTRAHPCPARAKDERELMEL